MDYLSTFSKTLKQWWNHKYLWIVGILGSILVGSGGNFSTFNSPGSSTNNAANTAIKDFLNNPGLMTTVAVIVVIALVIGLMLFALGMYLQARADSALFQATKQIRENDAQIGFWKTWALGKLRLKTLIGQQLLIGGPVYVLGLLFAVAVVVVLLIGRGNSNTMGPLFLALFGCFALFLCLAAIYAIIASIASVFGKRMSVFDNLGAIEGLKKGWKFFTTHFADVFVFWLISLVASFVIGIITFALVMALVIIAMIIIIPMIIINPILAIIVGVFVFLVFVLVMTLVEGPIYAFTQMYWTNVYFEIKKAKA